MLPFRILLVDDSESDLRLASEAIQEWEQPREIEIARSGERALNLLHRRNGCESALEPDLILLDLRMPAPDGFEVLASIKQDPRLRRIPVIVFATAPSPNHIEHAYDLQANVIVSKPMTLDGYSRALKEIERFWIQTVCLPRLLSDSVNSLRVVPTGNRK